MMQHARALTQPLPRALHRAFTLDRMKLASLLPIALLALSCGGHTNNVSTDGALRVSRVVLFQNGMAYVERRGRTRGDAIELRTREGAVHDVLKSLAVVDHGGGSVTGVRVLGDDDPRLRVQLDDDGEHDLSVAYVAEASGWRPTYRLVDHGEGRVRLQGLAVVDNPGGEAWENIRLALSTEVPLSFRYEVGTARVAARPTLGPDGRLRMLAAAPEVTIFDDEGNPAQLAYGAANRVADGTSARAGRLVGNALPDPTPSNPGHTTSPMDALDAQDPASGFTLEAPERLTLGAGESGLVPFVDEEVAGRRVLLFKPAPVVGTRPGASHHHPYRAVLFENPLDEAPLLGGPVTVYADGSFQGDGVTSTIPAGTHAFVAYAMSPSIRVDATERREQAEVRGLRVVGGTLTVSLREVVTHRFRISREGAGDPLYVYAPRREGFEPTEVPEGTVETPLGYYLRADSEDLVFRSVRPSETHVDLSSAPEHAYVPALLRLVEDQGEDVETLRTIVSRLEEIASRRGTLDEDLHVHERALRERRDSLAALRDVPANGALRRQLATSIAEGVRSVDALTREMVAGTEEARALRQDWYARLRILQLGT